MKLFERLSNYLKHSKIAETPASYEEARREEYEKQKSTLRGQAIEKLAEHYRSKGRVVLTNHRGSMQRSDLMFPLNEHYVIKDAPFHFVQTLLPVKGQNLRKLVYTVMTSKDGITKSFITIDSQDFNEGIKTLYFKSFDRELAVETAIRKIDIAIM